MELGFIIRIFISSIIVSVFFIYSGNKVFLRKIDYKLNTFVATIILIILITVNYLFLDNVAKTAISYITVLITYRALFNKPILQCAVASIVSFLGLTLGEVSFVAIVSILDLLNIIPTITNLGGDTLANLIIILIASLFIMISYKLINKILNKIKEYNKITLIITFTLLLTAICALFYKLYFHKYQWDNYLIVNLVLVVTLAYITFIIIKQHYDRAKLSDEYERYVEYSKQSERLVNQYSISQHENKNELIIIKSMVHKNNKELLEYLDEVITSKENIDASWIRHLRYLPFGGLKGIIHNKISEMKDNGINVFLDISKNIESSKLKDLTIKENNQLSKIIGVFLDNAYEASFLSVDKEVSISAYIEDDKITFEISNTYLDEVDISKIYETGNTSKGKGRGYGLSLVKAIISENIMFENTVKKIDKYFVQVLKINI